MSRGQHKGSSSFLVGESRKAKIGIKPLAAIVGLVLILGAVLFYITRSASTDSFNPNVKDLLNAKDDAAGKAGVVARYGSQYEVSKKGTANIKDPKLSAETLDKVYFNLIYADKLGLFTQVYQSLALLDLAKKNGVNIDQNSYGITQTKRDEIKNRADQKVEEVTKSNVQN